MAKIFSELVRKQVTKEVCKISKPLYDFLKQIHESDIALIGDDSDFEDEKPRLQTEEMAFLVLCAFEKLHDINEITVFHPLHLQLINDHLFKCINSIYSPKNFQEALIFKSNYVSFAYSLVVLYLYHTDVQLSKYMTNDNNIRRFKNSPSVNYYFSLDMQLLKDLNELAWGKQKDLTSAIKNFLMTEAINQKLKKSEKAKVVISWEDLINYISASDKENIDCLNTFLSGLLLEMVKDEGLYAPSAKMLIDKVKQIKNPPIQPNITVENMNIGKNNGSIFGDSSQHANLPADIEEQLPF